MEAQYLPPGTVVNTVNGNPLVGNAAVSSYDFATGALIFSGTTVKNNKSVDIYTVGLTDPSAGTSFSAVSAVSSNYAETAGSATANNRVQLTLPLAQPAAAAVGYDEATTLTGPATALPGSAVAYTVQSLNNGPVNSGTVTQVVTLPSDTVVTNNCGGTAVSNGTGVTITHTFINQAPGVGAEVANSFTVTMPTTSSLSVSVGTSAVGETGPMANNSALMTTPPQPTRCRWQPSSLMCFRPRRATRPVKWVSRRCRPPTPTAASPRSA